MKRFIFISIFIILATVSCSKDNPSYNSQPNAKVTYSNSIKAIVDNNCIRCHATVPVNGAPFSLVTYSDVKTHVVGIINRTSRDQGAVGMMPNGGTRLPQATIDQIVKWQSDGLNE
jgi:uncharacterized membrane protein